MNGIGVGVLRVHPLIMTLGTGLVVIGFLNVYQRTVLTSGSAVPAEFGWLGSGVSYGLPNSLLLFVPVALVIIIGLRRTGYGRLLYAVGDNPVAARLAGVRLWQVLLVLYIAVRGARGCRGPGVRRAHQDGLSAARRAVPAAIGGRRRNRWDVHLRRSWRLHGQHRRCPHPHRPDQPPDRASSSLRHPRQIIFGLIVLAVAAVYTRLTSDT